MKRGYSGHVAQAPQRTNVKLYTDGNPRPGVEIRLSPELPATIRTDGGGCRGASGSPGPFGSYSSLERTMAIRPSKPGDVRC